MSTLFERNLHFEEDECSGSKFDELVKDEHDILSIPLERLNEYFADFGINVSEIEEEEHHPQILNDIQSWSIITEIKTVRADVINTLQEDLDLSDYIDSADIDQDTMKLNINFTTEVELD